MIPPPRLAAFIAEMRALADTSVVEARLVTGTGLALKALVAKDDWLPPAYAQPHPDHYTQYLLHRDPWARFSVVSFVWGPGQGTPIHDHTVWGVVGVLRGAERSQRFTVTGDGAPQAMGVPQLLGAGDIEAVSPALGDIHRVTNAADGVSVSIHVYGADIGKIERNIYPVTGGRRRFVSGYANGAASPAFEVA